MLGCSLHLKDLQLPLLTCLSLFFVIMTVLLSCDQLQIIWTIIVVNDRHKLITRK